MLNLPPAMMTVRVPFAPRFQVKPWRQAPVRLMGTILTPGKPTITAVLRVMGLKEEVNYAKYHPVLNRAAWSPLAVAEGWLRLLVKAWVSGGEPLVLGIDETIERRWGQQIAARGS
jgi:hypothetical protein